MSFYVFQRNQRWHKWDSPCSSVGRINIVKMIYYPKPSTDSMQFLSKSLRAFFTELEKKKIVLCKKHKGH